VPVGRTGEPLDEAGVRDTVLAGALRRWLEDHGGPLHDLRVRVPVSIHQEGSAALNRDSSFTLPLPLHVVDPSSASMPCTTPRRHARPLCAARRPNSAAAPTRGRRQGSLLYSEGKQRSDLDDDTWIAAACLAYDLPLATLNVN
jgi:hypothetical protein